MEITTLTDKLFDGIVKKKKPVVLKDTDNMVSREAKALEYQINKHLHDKYKKTEKVTFTKPISPQSSSKFDNIIDDEIITNRKKAKTWNTLNTCDKWTLVKEYFKNNKETFNEKRIKNLLLSNTLQVIYDKNTNCIKSISLEDTPKLG